jgi:hypothetical protein
MPAQLLVRYRRSHSTNPENVERPCNLMCVKGDPMPENAVQEINWTDAKEDFVSDEICDGKMVYDVMHIRSWYLCITMRLCRGGAGSCTVHALPGINCKRHRHDVMMHTWTADSTPVSKCDDKYDDDAVHDGDCIVGGL